MNQDYIQPDNWSIIEEGFDAERVKSSESLFSIGNGAMGQRANFEEHYSGKTFQGSYIAGIYYPDKTKVGWWKNGYPEYFAKVLNAPNWIGIDIEINGENLDLAKCQSVSNFRRELNMKEGIYYRSFNATLANGIEIAVKVQRFLSLDLDEVGVINYEITALNSDAKIVFKPYVDAGVHNEDANWEEKFWEPISVKHSGNEAFVTARTFKTHFTATTFMHNSILLEGSNLSVAPVSVQETKDKIFNEIKKHNVNDIDVLIATPPCQGMSDANHNKKDKDIKRNSLVVESIKMILLIKPKVFVFENVKAFLKTNCTDLDGLDKPILDAIMLNLSSIYNIEYKILNFKDYGANSSRTRTLVIGTRKDININPLDLFPNEEKPKTIKEVIGDLKPLTIMGEILEDDIYHSFRKYDIKMLNWIKDIKEGESAFNNVLDINKPHKIIDNKIIVNKNSVRGKYTRNFWDKVSPCIQTRNDIFSAQYTIHPEQNRVFSIRELMLFMNIPHSFKWTNLSFEELNKLSLKDKIDFLKKNELNIRHSIGESVPTIIFSKIALNIKKRINHK